MKTALLVGNFGARNKGDELILLGLLNICSEYGAHPVVVSHNPKETRKSYSVESVSRLPFGIRSFFSGGLLATLKAYAKADVVILGGGGLFVDRFWVAPYIWGFHGLLAIMLHKPLIMVGHSFEIRHVVGRFFVKFLARRAKILTVRDIISLKYAQKLLGSSICVSRAPDLAVLPLLKLSFCASKENIIGISLCRWGYSPFLFQRLQEFVSYLLRNGYSKVRFFPFQTGFDNDENVMRDFSGGFDASTVEHIDYDDEEFFKKFSECSFVLGMRLHSLICAYVLKIPFIGIAYQEKVFAFGQEMGLEHFVVQLQDVFSLNLCKIHKELFDSDDLFSRHHVLCQSSHEFVLSLKPHLE